MTNAYQWVPRCQLGILVRKSGQKFENEYSGSLFYKKEVILSFFSVAGSISKCVKR